MIKELKKHTIAYIILVLFLVLGVVLFLGAWPDKNLQRLIGVSIGIFYLIWGILTHLHSANITQKIVLEYLGVSALASLLLILITW